MEVILNFDCGFLYLYFGLYYFMMDYDDFEYYLMVDDILNLVVKYFVNLVVICILFI